MPPLDPGKARRAAGLALAAIVMRRAGQLAARRGARTEPRVAIAVMAVDVVVTIAVVVLRRRVERRLEADLAASEPVSP